MLVTDSVIGSMGRSHSGAAFLVTGEVGKPIRQEVGMGTRGNGERAVSKSGSETSGVHLPLDDYIERLKALGLKVKAQQSGLGNDWIHVRHPQSGHTAQVRFFEEPSEFGIDGGRISKLWVAGPDGKARVEYDRGWNKRPPKSGTAKVLYESLVSLAREPGEGKRSR